MKRYKPLFTGIRDNFSFFNEAVIKVATYDKILYSFFTKCKPQIQNKKLSIDEIIKILNENFSSLKIIFQLDKLKNREEGGTDSDAYNTIYIFLVQGSYKRFFVYNDEYISLLLKIIHHELIHRNQAIRMKSQEIISKIFEYDPEEIKEYLEQKVEIMPFAFMVVEESRAHGWSDDKILQNLKTFSSPSVIFNGYLDYFDKDSRIIKMLVKYIYMYLQK